MAWVNVFMLLLVALLLGWVPVLGPLLLGVLAGRAEKGPRAVLVLLPALVLQTLGLLGVRWLENAVEARGLDGWLWTALAWLGSPLAAALGRPLGNVIGDSDLTGFLLLFTLPAVLGLVLRWVTARPSRRL
ncbi:hypothetical protein DEIPH_ctg004orf0037 [Deinococcus phoenicis]|uniref:Uncharacterized protein n=1 Tax=Deinococcus phoenicis TaxID=1476583 RepID=A0A016QUA6_9DEIO|nr:hypothetical protein [Deinococcus phoenicis]EYB69531.1 hypothetical protein DEIPH_ctg004orf0037 [Deinococcus phoenicis]